MSDAVNVSDVEDEALGLRVVVAVIDGFGCGHLPDTQPETIGDRVPFWTKPPWRLGKALHTDEPFDIGWHWSPAENDAARIFEDDC